MSEFVSVAETLDRIAGSRFDTLSDADKIEVDDVLEAAAAWASGALPIWELANVGTMLSPVTGKPSSAYTRYSAVLATPVIDPRRGELLRAIDALINAQGMVITSFGIFDTTDLVDVPILIRHPDRSAP